MNVELLIWLASSCAGLLLSIVGMRDAQLDMAALRALPRNGRWMIARHQLIRNALRVGITSAFIGAGLLGGDWTVTLLIVANIALLATIGSDLATAAFLRAGVRQAYLEEREK